MERRQRGNVGVGREECADSDGVAEHRACFSHRDRAQFILQHVLHHLRIRVHARHAACAPPFSSWWVSGARGGIGSRERSLHRSSRTGPPAQYCQPPSTPTQDLHTLPQYRTPPTV
eukprot:3940648-Rhodomonas_salina.1